MVASYDGQQYVVKTLIDAGANVNQADKVCKCICTCFCTWHSN